MQIDRKLFTLLVVGLGSMGKRRIRNLKLMGFDKIYGYDERKDRSEEAEKTLGVKIIANINAFIEKEKVDALIISVPPDVHHVYIKKAIEKNIHFFVEASVVDSQMDEFTKLLSNSSIVAAPSATLYFHPAVKLISEIIKNKELGLISNFIYHSGQYLPDWHSYEKVEDYYVSKKETGGAREIVPFELTWITKIFGFPKSVSGNVKKTIAIKGAESIDDTYNALLDYGSFTVNLIVDVVSRHATRKLIINGSEKQLSWNWDDNCIKIFDPKINDWIIRSYEVNSSASGYNKNITEQMYLDELDDFLAAIEGKKEFFNSLEYDHKVLKLLYSIERSSKDLKAVEL
jgi:predicted dehydrogenase